MMGTPEQQGVIPRAMQQVFETSRQLGTQGWSFNMQASMLEIYNEEYKDLLAKKRLPEGKKHMVRGPAGVHVWAGAVMGAVGGVAPVALQWMSVFCTVCLKSAGTCWWACLTGL